MLHKAIKGGFTLIELLVVITIIGILATGATTVYTSQIQKARDTTRIKDIDALRVAAEQVYQDSAEYPHSNIFVEGDATITGMSTYIKQLPRDAKHSQTCNNGWAGSVDCGYAYVVGQDTNGIDYGAYEFSTAFESEGNVVKKAAGDAGQDPIRYETGLELNTLVTAVAAAAITPGSTNWACDLTGAIGTATELIVINGNPTTLGSTSCN